MLDKLKWGLVIVVSMVLGGAMVIGIDSMASDDDPAPATVMVTPEPTPESDSPPAPISNPNIDNLADLYEQVRPSIVQIRAGDSFSNSGGSGSGVVLDEEGHILTNNHVVGAFDRIDVVFADGTAAAATVIGRDPGNDLAVIRAEAPSGLLQPATLGDSSSVRAGESVFAVGNPFDLDGSITEGIVSGIGRRLEGGIGRPLRELIQADAAINPGNSGGALFNDRGEVIGITTAIENPSGDRVFVGIGYAVPINTATRYLPQMLNGETVQHPRLGVSLRDVTPAMSEAMGLSVEQGVFVNSVFPGTAADRSGLRGGVDATGRAVGDVIVAIDGEEIQNFDDLAAYVDSRSVGDTVEVTVARDGAELVLPVVLEAWLSN